MDKIELRTVENLDSLIDTYEHIRIEFKSSLLFYDNKTDKPRRSEYIDVISKEISGFANTEGGHLVVGIETEKRNNEPDKAVKLDRGIAFKDFNVETIQRSIEASISPPLPGLRFIPIRTQDDKGRYYLVIEVPKGNTAYQAKNRIYYGRSEFETTPLHDSVVRLLMTKDKEPHATIKLDNVQVTKTEYLEQNSIEYTCSFEIYLENDGEIDISEFKIIAKLHPPVRGLIRSLLEHSKLLLTSGEIYHYRDKWPAPRSAAVYYDAENPIAINIYPKDRFFIGKYQFTYRYTDLHISDEEYANMAIEKVKVYLSGDFKETAFYDETMKALESGWEESQQKALQLYWIAYLSNTRPIEGSINFVEVLDLDSINR